MQQIEQHNRELAEPTWEVARLFPNQGCWSEDEYIALQANRLVELSAGHLEVLPIPTEEHQSIVAFVYGVIHTFVFAGHLGKVLFAPLRVRLWDGKFREPDVVFMLTEHSDRRENRYWRGADLVVEVVSEDDPDCRTKRDEYAKAGVAEFWLVDPRNQTITVLTLKGQDDTYRIAGQYSRGQQADSVLLSGLNIDVERTFSA